MKTIFNASLMFLFVAALISSCEKKDDKNLHEALSKEEYAKMVSITEGIWGAVLFLEGDHMPGPGGPSGKTYGVRREILVYEPVTMFQAEPVEKDGSEFYVSVPTRLIKSVQSDDNGFYQLNLPPGIYSLFVKEKGFLYQTFTGYNGYLGEVVVNANAATEMSLKITYAAAF